MTDAEGLTDTATRDVTVTDGGSGGAPTLDDPVATRISGPWAYADLTWTAGTGSVDVYRGAQLVATTTSSTYSDRVGRKSEVAGQTFTYTVCLAGTGTCSNAATASF